MFVRTPLPPSFSLVIRAPHNPRWFANGGRMRKLGRIIGRLLLGVLIIAVVLAAGGIAYFKGYMPGTVAPRSFPQIDGQIHLQGLNAPVDIYRDYVGVPHIYASTTHDLF